MNNDIRRDTMEVAKAIRNGGKPLYCAFVYTTWHGMEDENIRLYRKTKSLKPLAKHVKNNDYNAPINCSTEFLPDYFEIDGDKYKIDELSADETKNFLDALSDSTEAN